MGVITLTASLVVAYIINPVFAVDFMRSDDHGDANSPQAKKRHRNVLIGFFILIAVGYLYAFGLGNVFVVILLFYLLDKYVLTKAIYRFQNSIWPAFQERYRRLL